MVITDIPISTGTYTMGDSWSIERFVCTHHIWAGRYSHMLYTHYSDRYFMARQEIHHTGILVMPILMHEALGEELMVGKLKGVACTFG